MRRSIGGSIRRSKTVALLVVATIAGASCIAGSAAAAPVGSAVTKQVTATRSNQLSPNGPVVTVDTRTVTLNVSATTNLRNQQRITVSWSGAHPTGSIQSNFNSVEAIDDEYPMVILQCRGLNPDPTTCWSPYTGSRSQLSPGRSIVYPPWRLDRYATLADRAQYANEPTPSSAHCPDIIDYGAETRLPFKAVDGTVYYGSGGADTGCGIKPPESNNSYAASAPSLVPDNATYAPTALDGTGSVLFSLTDETANASLGCSAKVQCSLVAIPIMGISCDDGYPLTTPAATPTPTPTPTPSADPTSSATPPAASPSPTATPSPTPAADPVEPVPADDEANCEASGAMPPGSFSQPSFSKYTVTGRLWSSASNWRNRMVVPLSFSPTSGSCATSQKEAVDVYGSELLIQATGQWIPKICENTNEAPFKHIQTGEPLARSQLDSGSVEAAFVSDPPDGGFSEPVVQAPVAVTGFAISYTIDNAKHQPYHSLRLTPRLLAKLMTESYLDSDHYRQTYTYHIPGSTDPPQYYKPFDSHQPLNITVDPEFIALNPGVGSSVDLDGGPQALLSLASNSDVISALTSYINADPEARSWLDGTPDPWGMRVNPNYQGISLPTNSWPLLDTWNGPPDSTDPCINPTLQNTPLTLLASPLQRLVAIEQSVRVAQGGGQTACSEIQKEDGSLYTQPARSGPQVVGRRFVIGLTSLADARRYDDDVASLQTQLDAKALAKKFPEATTYPDEGPLFTDDTARTFVQPTTASLKAAAAMLVHDDSTMTWPIPYSAMESTAKGLHAYPGTMVVYADIPTSGLPHADAVAYSQMLNFIINNGETPGTAAGQLPDGYLPITSANGLGALASYTLTAAAAVASQGATVPDSTTSNGTPVTQQIADQSEQTAVQQSSPQSAAPVTGSTPAAATPTIKDVTTVQAVGKTSSISTEFGVAALVVLLCLLLVGPIAVPLLVLSGRRGGK
ncbi:hypothetical protein SAMN05444157_3449 [Frankineae bacterium MT45]|nr:hypothetical protein SAMN05444157_3449 [Frankineae bacterium MT45]